MGRGDKAIKLTDITNKKCCYTEKHPKKDVCVQSLKPFHFEDQDVDLEGIGHSYIIEKAKENAIDGVEEKKESIKKFIHDFAASFDMDDCE